MQHAVFLFILLTMVPVALCSPQTALANHVQTTKRAEQPPAIYLLCHTRAINIDTINHLQNLPLFELVVWQTALKSRTRRHGRMISILKQTKQKSDVTPIAVRTLQQRIATLRAYARYLDELILYANGSRWIRNTDGDTFSRKRAIRTFANLLLSRARWENSELASHKKQHCNRDDVSVF